MSIRNIIVLTVVAVMFTATGIKVANDVNQAHAADKAYDTAFGISDDVQSADVQPAETTKKKKPTMTSAQRNALESAESYLDGQAFSKSGLVKQLKFEHFSASDARWAAKHVKVSWMEEAVESAEGYLDGQSFSRQSLIDQLKFDGFTQPQAEHGVSVAYH